MRAPERPGPTNLRCPVCKAVFRSEGASGGPADASGAPASGAGSPDTVSFSEIDQDDLSRYGSGSGLLELTRESDDTSLGDVFYSAEKSAAEKSAAATGVSPALRQVDPAAGAAVEMANRLAETHLAELKRSRRGARLAWVIVGLLVLAAGATIWYATRQTGRLELAEQRASGLTDELRKANDDLAELKSGQERLRTELAAALEQVEAAHTERRSLQT
ncbi:MAG TPA: hypothetical protein VMW48_02565, partial [Vicinamibacterales bacterium]|nr:hypothetical protein [Vicinamibacterales bacterium]